MKQLKVIDRLEFQGRMEIWPGGYNSEICALFHNGYQEIVKIIGNKKGPLNEKTGRQLAEDIKIYHHLLQKVGMRIPDSDIQLLHNRKNGSWNVILVEPYVGVSSKESITHGEERECLKLVEMILESIEPILNNLHGNSQTEVEIGLDPKPENFTVQDRTMFFVDKMPPRFRKKGELLVEFPQPKTTEGLEVGRFRHFDKRGLLLILQTQLCRLRPKLRAQFKKMILEAGGPLIRDYFTQSTWERFQHAGNITEQIGIITNIGGSNPYDFREIAAEIVAQNGRYDRNDLERIFKLTHFEDGLEQQTINYVQKILIRMAKNLPLL